MSLVVELAFVRASWFFLDDIRNLAEARQRGLTWGFLTSPIGEHFSPGHRLLDWIVAVPLGLHWAAAIGIMLVFSGVMLAYLAGALTLLFGPGRRHAIPVLLAGTAWPLMGAAQWFAGGALAIPVSAAIAGAIYHHLRWRSRGAGRDWAASAAWTIVGLLFSQQAILILPFLVVCALVAAGGRVPLGSFIREIVAVLPLLAPALALQLYVAAQPWAASVSLPSLTNFIELVRVIVVRALLPALTGIGMDGAPPDPSREVLMRALATAGIAAALMAAAWLGRRWCAALALAGCGAVLTALPIALARLSVGVTMAGSEPRYLLPAVMLSALAIGALLTVQAGRAPRALPPAATWLVAALGIGWLGIYAANLSYTYKTRRVYLDFAHASHQSATRLERGLRAALAAGGVDAIVDGPLPYPLFYVQPSGNLRSAYSQFFTPGGIAAPGIPEHGDLLSIASDGALQRVAVRPAGPAVRCPEARPCQVPGGGAPAPSDELVLTIQLLGPAPTGEWIHYVVSGPPDEAPHRTLEIPRGATRLVIPAESADLRSVVVSLDQHPFRIRSARVGVLVAS